MKKFYIALLSIFILVGCSDSDSAQEVKSVVETAIPADEEVVVGEVVTLPASTIEELVVSTPLEVIVPTVEVEVPEEVTEQIVVEPIADIGINDPIINMTDCINPVEFIPFDHTFNMPYYLEDYEAIANQTVVHIGDCVEYGGEEYLSLRNHNTMPDKYNVEGNPFWILTDQAFDGGYFFRTKSNEATCIEKVTMTGFDDIEGMSVWKKDWYTHTVAQTEGCSGYPEMEDYVRLGQQLATSLYGAVALGSWKFRIGETIYTGYSREYVIVPTPGTDDSFWEIQN